jgi:quinol monooxygenase YgiN
MTYVACVTYCCVLGKEGELEAVFAELASATRSEPGCSGYELYKDRETAGMYFLFEAYVDEAAYRRHQATAHFERLAKGVIPSLVTDRTIRRYMPVYLGSPGERTHEVPD